MPAQYERLTGEQAKAAVRLRWFLAGFAVLCAVIIVLAVVLG